MIFEKCERTFYIGKVCVSKIIGVSIRSKLLYGPPMVHFNAVTVLRSTVNSRLASGMQSDTDLRKNGFRFSLHVVARPESVS
jgi:hypothetical protein